MSPPVLATSGGRTAKLTGWFDKRCSGAGTRGTASPTFFDRGTRPPPPPLFWNEIRAKVSPLLQLVTF